MSILGIDHTKASYPVTLFHAEQTHCHRFQNNAAAFADLTHGWQPQGVTALHACMEAPGRYGEPRATYLHRQGYPVRVVNPAQIKPYAKSQLRRTKTDKVDADVIAHFAQTQQPSVWQPTASEIRELTELVQQYDTLHAARQPENNRLPSGVQSELGRELLTKHLAFLDAQRAEVLRRLAEHIERLPDLKANQTVLTSISGIGALTAAKLLTLELQRFDSARAATAFVGLNPQQHESGASVHRRARLSKMGDAACALYAGGLRQTV